MSPKSLMNVASMNLRRSTTLGSFISGKHYSTTSRRSFYTPCNTPPRSSSSFSFSNSNGSNNNARSLSTSSGLPTHYTLNTGDKIPSVALGVWKSAKDEVGIAVKTALDTGYRHIDGAWAYRNEEEVGQAIKSSNVPRKDLWLTSKLHQYFHAPEEVEPALDDSLKKLGTDYLDLYLIHWPIALNKDTNTLNKELTENPYPTWQAMEELVKKGKIRNIGLSNFNIRRLDALLSNSLNIKPAVNQVELNLWNPQPKLVEWCKEHSIVVEAYSPLGSSKQVGRSLGDPLITKSATELGMTPAQVIVSWHIQRGTVVLPKSVTPTRIRENFQVKKLPTEVFESIERSARERPQERMVSMGKDLGVDVFEE